MWCTKRLMSNSAPTTGLTRYLTMNNNDWEYILTAGVWLVLVILIILSAARVV